MLQARWQFTAAYFQFDFAVCHIYSDMQGSGSGAGGCGGSGYTRCAQPSHFADFLSKQSYIYGMQNYFCLSLFLNVHGLFAEGMAVAPLMVAMEVGALEPCTLY